jgi:putative ABC transport system permease protein
VVRPLDRKLLRDLGRIKGQAVAIGLVIALGVLMLVMMDGVVNTLEQTRDAYYARYRLADVFAPVKRAPKRLLAELTQIPHVTAVEGRITGDALIDLPGLDIPLRARAVSLPDFGSPGQNDVHLTGGRLPGVERGGEILLLKSFANARQLVPGDSLAVTMNGAYRRLQIVGLAESPEFLYTTAPGELAPDDGRFAVIWMREKALAAAYDMEGAFNEALLALGPDARLPGVLDAVDRTLANYGGLGAYGLEDQASNRLIVEELSGLRAASVGVPPVFMAVAAFLLYIVVFRIVQAERLQIGLLKAFGYSGNEVSLHYLKLVLIIALGGALAGSLMGIVAGRSLAAFYQNYFKFPFILFQVDPTAFAKGIVVSTVTAALGGLWVLRSVFALTPAVAMRPPAPADYSRARGLADWLKLVLDQPSRMVLRRVQRQPGRMAGAVLGIASGMALSVGMVSMLAGFDRTLDLTFNVLDRSDATVLFTHPLSDRTVFDLQHVPGVTWVEPFRSVPVIFRYGTATYRGAISGLVEHPRLSRALDRSQNAIALGKGGIVLSAVVARMLKVVPGDLLTVQVREGRRPTLQIPVAGISEALLGAPTYMELATLNRFLREPHHISGAYLQLDSARNAAVYRTLKDMPAVAGVTRKQDSKVAFRKLMDTGAGAMRYIMALIAGVITFGIVYNSARIAYAERERDLASLRVIGFTRGEAAFVLLGELAIVTLAALPIGAFFGYYLSITIAEGFSTDIYQIPAIYSPQSFGVAGIAVVLAATASGWLVKRDIDRVDLVAALKSKE